MTYLEFKSLVQDLHTGATIPNAIDDISKLVLGKIARVRLKNRIKVGEITVGSDVSWNLDTEFGDFIALKADAENNNKCVYYMESATPIWLKQTNHSRFMLNTGGGFATLLGHTLKVNFGASSSSVSTLFVPYFSKFLVLDTDGITEKEKPVNDDDTFLLDSIFDDAFVDGVLLYIKRAEMDDGEFSKAITAWKKSLNDLIFYQ